MNIQEIVVGFIVLCAIVYVVRRYIWLPKQVGKKLCGTGCGKCGGCG